MRLLGFTLFAAAVALAAVIGPETTRAEPIPPVAAPVTVVELFTSEGCSSCPPADALLAELDKRDDVLVLGFHVDYWDRLGWKDRFSHADHTTRQRQYAQILGERGVYTPQAVVGGTAGVVGSDRKAVVGLLEKATPANALDVTVEGDAVRADAAAGHWVNAAYVRPAAETKVERGENAGRRLAHVNAVVAFASTRAGEDGRVTFALPRPADGDRLVVYEQEPTGRIIRVATP